MANDGAGIGSHAMPPRECLGSLFGQHADAIGNVLYAGVLGQPQEGRQAFAICQFVG